MIPGLKEPVQRRYIHKQLVIRLSIQVTFDPGQVGL